MRSSDSFTNPSALHGTGRSCTGVVKSCQPQHLRQCHAGRLATVARPSHHTSTDASGFLGATRVAALVSQPLPHRGYKRFPPNPKLLHGFACKCIPDGNTLGAVAASTIVTFSSATEECLHEAWRQAAAIGAEIVQPAHLLLGCLAAGSKAASSDGASETASIHASHAAEVRLLWNAKTT
jgi:hypothetical protein